MVETFLLHRLRKCAPLVARICVGLSLGLAGGAAVQAVPVVDYTFTISRTLVYGTETLGGPDSPVTFTVRIDSKAPDVGFPNNPGLYPFGLDYPGSAIVTVGGTTTQLESGVLNIDESVVSDQLDIVASGVGDGTRILGRSLFFAWLYLEDVTGEMFKDFDLPKNDNFESYITGGYFRLQFQPAPGDPEYGTGEYVRFDARLRPGDVEVTRRVVPEPGTLALLAVSVLTVGLIRRQHHHHHHHHPPQARAARARSRAPAG